MWTLGKWAILTHDELAEIKQDERALGYQAGLRSKWRAKKNQSFIDDVLAANRGDATTAVGKILNGVDADIHSLLSSVDESVVIPQREAA